MFVKESMNDEIFIDSSRLTIIVSALSNKE